MPSRLITLFSLPCLAASLLVSVAGPAAAEEPIEAADRVHGGMYIEEWDTSTQLDGMAVWVGKRVSFLGTFHDVNEDDLLPPGPYSNTITKLEEAWQAKATPFANLAINAGAASIAAGHHDQDIRAWALKVQRWLAKGGERSLIIAPLQEMNGDWVPYGMDPGGFKSAYHRIRGIVREVVVDDTQV
ncbi:MAG: hypothetical protein M3N51_00955, partial [Actinomycetota bacterium]|nr:hypothetical protein [Actinomycetota bacterium]